MLMGIVHNSFKDGNSYINDLIQCHKREVTNVAASSGLISHLDQSGTFVGKAMKQKRKIVPNEAIEAHKEKQGRQRGKYVSKREKRS